MFSVPKCNSLSEETKIYFTFEKFHKVFKIFFSSSLVTYEYKHFALRTVPTNLRYFFPRDVIMQEM